jgi:hypothetical protein
MDTMRKALGLLVLAAFLTLTAAPVLAHGGSNDGAEPNITSSTTDADLISWGVLQDHENNGQ